MEVINGLVVAYLNGHTYINQVLLSIRRKIKKSVRPVVCRTIITDIKLLFVFDILYIYIFKKKKRRNNYDVENT